jgi:integrase
VRLFQRSKKHKREGVTEEEMARLTSYLRELPATPVNLRLKALVALLALQGLRQIEVQRLADGPVFPSWHHSGSYERLTLRAIHQLVSEAFAEVGIDKTPHGLRHFFTTTLLKSYQGEQRILDVLLKSYPLPLTGAELALRSRYTYTQGGRFGGNVRRLRRAGLVDFDGTSYRASSSLFTETAA